MDDRSIRIVLIDDHELVLSAMANVMRLESDFDVVGTGTTVLAALQLAQDTSPDVVVIDYSLPDGDGAEGTRRILAVAPDVRVIMLTGMDDPAVRAAAFEAGCTAFVAKGARLDELVRAVRTAVATPG